MKIVRSIVVWLASVLCALMISAAIWLAALQATVLNASVVKSWLQNSGVYDNLIQTIVPQVSGPSSNVFTTQVTKQALEGTFPPSYVQQQAEGVLDSVYAWLNGKAPAIAFSIPIDQQKSAAIKSLAAALQPTLAALPTCSTNTPPQIDNLACRPTNMSADQLANDLATQSVGNSQLLDKPLTSQDIVGQKTSIPSFLGQLPEYNRLINQLVVWLPVASLACIFIVFFTAEDRLRALAKLLRRIFTGSVFTLILGGLAFYVGKYMPLSKTSGPVDLSVLLANVAKQALQGIGEELALLSGIAAAISLAGWIAVHKLRKKREEKELLKMPTDEADVQTNADESPAKKTPKLSSSKQ